MEKCFAHITIVITALPVSMGDLTILIAFHVEAGVSMLIPLSYSREHISASVLMSDLSIKKVGTSCHVFLHILAGRVDHR